jgi:hypothetical protein
MHVTYTKFALFSNEVSYFWLNHARALQVLQPTLFLYRLLFCKQHTWMYTTLTVQFETIVSLKSEYIYVHYIKIELSRILNDNNYKNTNVIKMQ